MLIKKCLQRFCSQQLNHSKVIALYEQTKKNIDPHRVQLMSHPLYQRVKNKENLVKFMENHGFAVYDFMSLLKRLQMDITCVRIPWTPKPDPSVQFFINQIVLGEQCDDLGVSDPAKTTSHYHLYLAAMRNLTADTSQIEDLVKSIDLAEQKGENVQKSSIKKINSMKAQAKNNLHPNTLEFIKYSFNVAFTGKTHEVASSFLFGREDPIPQMYIEIVKTLKATNIDCSDLVAYLERHIDVDSKTHSVLAMQMIQALCKEDEQKWHEVENVAKESIQQRIYLWDGVLQKL